jgi:hypothetical protein
MPRKQTYCAREAGHPEGFCASPGHAIFIDHDHACCPGKRSCGRCLRGLLHRTCNVAVGYFETYGDLIRAYLQPQTSPMKSPGPGR